MSVQTGLTTIAVGDTRLPVADNDQTRDDAEIVPREIVTSSHRTTVTIAPTAACTPQDGGMNAMSSGDGGSMLIGSTQGSGNQLPGHRCRFDIFSGARRDWSSCLVDCDRV